jgi:alkylated DNA repair dioxygenase AlkB
LLKLENRLIAKDGEVFYWPHFFNDQMADQLYAQLFQETQWRQEKVRVFGRWYPQPRLVAWHGDPQLSYTYAGLRLEPQAWTPTLTKLRDEVSQAIGASFNSVLLNLYRDGQDCNGWHSDDEPELGPEPVIASLSFGAKRDFLMKHKTLKSESLKLELGHGSLLLMGGPCQAHWKHTLPRRKRVNQARINLTFRKILTST